MNRKTRLILAAIVTVILAISATTVWAGKKEGSLSGKIHDGTGTCNGNLINMGDATFKMTVRGRVICNFKVTRKKVPNAQMGGAPTGTEYRSDGFLVEGGPKDGIGVLEVCFAYSPLDEAANTQIYGVFSTGASVLAAAKQGTPSMLCAATGSLNGSFALIGTPSP